MLTSYKFYEITYASKIQSDLFDIVLAKSKSHAIVEFLRNNYKCYDLTIINVKEIDL